MPYLALICNIWHGLCYKRRSIKLLDALSALGDLLQCPDYRPVIRLDGDIVGGSLYTQVAAQNATIEDR